MEPFLIDIYPSSAQDTKLSAHEGEEFIYVLSGEIEIVYGTETYRLGAGDSIYYDSIVAHHVHCSGDRPAQMLAVVYARRDLGRLPDGIHHRHPGRGPGGPGRPTADREFMVYPTGICGSRTRNSTAGQRARKGLLASA